MKKVYDLLRCYRGEKKYIEGQRIHFNYLKGADMEKILEAVEEKEKDIEAHGMDCWLGCDKGVWFLEVAERR